MIASDSGSQPATGLLSDTASWHALDAAEVMRQLDATCAGLGSAAAEARRQRFGENALPTAPPPSIWVRLLRQLADPLVGALLVAAAVASAVAVVEGASEDSLLVRFSDAIAIVTIVLLNTALGLAQEQRAGKALEALRKLSTGTARVLRDGHWQSLPLTVLVPGDIVALEAGDAVPADLRVLEAHEFATVEASLTGEARPTTKTTTPQTEGAPLAERRNLLFLGTHIARGTGRGVVVETGARTALGRIGALVADEAQPKTPLELRLAHFGRVILLVCIVVAAGLFALGITIGEHPWPMLLLTAVSLAVAAIPEGLPAITTITLALGMERMATRGAIVRKLPAVETLGSATIICSDKTGTLTENAMNVQRLFTGDGHYRLRGTGYEPEGTLLDESGGKLAVLPPALQRLLECGALCGTTHLMRGDDGLRHVVGDPTEAA
ncbi:MAG: HAD-IC family P-type ATPase, partial [Myxococcota bacterium]